MEEFKDWLAAAEKEVDTKIIGLNGNTLDDVISQFAVRELPVFVVDF
ncbi:unnamed protein product, partial [Dibothriocephalus latus]